MSEYGEERRYRHHHSMAGWQETAIANLGNARVWVLTIQSMR